MFYIKILRTQENQNQPLTNKDYNCCIFKIIPKHAGLFPITPKSEKRSDRSGFQTRSWSFRNDHRVPKWNHVLSKCGTRKWHPPELRCPPLSLCALACPIVGKGPGGGTRPSPNASAEEWKQIHLSISPSLYQCITTDPVDKTWVIKCELVTSHSARLRNNLRLKSRSECIAALTGLTQPFLARACRWDRVIIWR